MAHFHYGLNHLSLAVSKPIRSLLACLTAVFAIGSSGKVLVQAQEAIRPECNHAWMIPGEGTLGRCLVHWSIPDHKMEFGYFHVDQSDGAILKRDHTLRHRPPILNRRGEPQFSYPKDADYLEHALAEGNAIAVIPDAASDRTTGKEYTWLVPGDRFFAWYAIEGSSLAWWRYCAHADRPKVLTSLDTRPVDDHRIVCSHGDQGAHRIQVPIANSVSQESSKPTTCCEVTVVFQPIALEDAYVVFPEGDQFDGAPATLQVDVPEQEGTHGLGLLYNDYSFHQKPLQVTHIRVESPNLLSPDREPGEWLPMLDFHDEGHVASRSVVDSRIHGSIKVYSNGGFQFEPDRDDPFWKVENHPIEPIPVFVQYKVSDGMSSTTSRFGIGHGYYHRGSSHDHKHEGVSSYFLGGGGHGRPFLEGRRRFFTSAADGKDIVLIAQSLENREFADLVFEDFASGKARSICSINISTPDQANDPRMAEIVAGADVIWIGGGSQSCFLDSWKGTRIFDALEVASAQGVSIGGTSAGTAILGQAAYVNFPWDSTASTFTLQDPSDDRNRVLFQGRDTLPFSALSSDAHAPLHRFLVDTHFTELNRMGRLVSFTAKQPYLYGLGIDASTAIFIEKEVDDWKWTIYGAGSVFIVESPQNQIPSQSYPLAVRPWERIHLIQLKAGQSLPLSSILQSPLSHRVFLSKNTVFTPDYSGKIYGGRRQ